MQKILSIFGSFFNILYFFGMKAVYVLLLIAITLAIETPTPGKKVLVIVERDSLKTSHSQFFENLKSILIFSSISIIDKGCELEIVKVDDSFSVSKYGEFLYDHIVLMLESEKKYNSLKFKEFKSFIDFHGDVFVMFGSSPNEFVRKLAGYAGIEIDAAGSSVVDHFTAVTGSDNIYHTKFTTSGYAKVFLQLFVECRSPVWLVILLHVLVQLLTRVWVCVSPPTTSYPFLS